MRLSDLRDKEVRTAKGERLGRVHEVHCEGGRVAALMVGPASLVERLTAKKQGLRIAWERVRKVDSKQILLRADAPKRRKRKS